MSFSWTQQRRDAAIDSLEQSSWLRHTEWLLETDSTNTHARRQLAAGLGRWPALFVADRQTAGRGRNTRSWWSPEGCLMLSLVVGQEQLPSDPALWPQLSLVTGVAVATAVEAEAPQSDVKLKWPNDLYVQSRKLAGILVEAIPQAVDGQMAFVIGIGLNVAVDWSRADIELRGRACSMSQFADRDVSVESVLLRLMEHLEHWLGSWRAGETAWWQQWCDRSLLSGCSVQLQLGSSQQLIGDCEGIDRAGRLLIRDSEHLHHIQSADVLAWQLRP